LLLYLYLCFSLYSFKGVGARQNVAIQVTVDFLNVCTSVAFFYMFLVLDMPSVATAATPDRNKGFRKNFSIIVGISFVIFLVSSLGRFRPGTYELGVYLSGIFAAISMAYVFGRLDSHYMNVPRWMLAPLYLYAAIQVIGPIVVNYSGQIPDKYHTLFFGAVLMLKVYLFFVMTYWLQNGSFEEYFNTGSNYIEGRNPKETPSEV
ncbi:MAG: hypothetical protein QOG00_3370, partial [Pyrinomonadaceae bacterium]|nr:hypothetical protein [Pyrinomonadaceae bacterium]